MLDILDQFVAFNINLLTIFMTKFKILWVGLLMSFLLVSCGQTNTIQNVDNQWASAKVQEVLPKKLSFEELKTKIVNNLFEKVTTESDKIIWEKWIMNINVVADNFLSGGLVLESEGELKWEDTAGKIKLNADWTVMWQSVGGSVNFDFISLSQSWVAYFKLNDLDISKIESSLWSQWTEIKTITEKLKSKWVKIKATELGRTNTLKSILVMNKLKTLTNDNFPLSLSWTEWEDNGYYTYPISLDKEATVKLIIWMAEISPENKITDSEKADLVSQLSKISLKGIIWVSKKSYDDFYIKLEFSSTDVPETVYLDFNSGNNKVWLSISDKNTGSWNTSSLAKFAFKFDLVWEDMIASSMVDWKTILTSTGKVSYIAGVSNYDISMNINAGSSTGMPPVKVRMFGNSSVKAKPTLDYVIPTDAEDIDKVLANTSSINSNDVVSYSEDKFTWLKAKFLKNWTSENVSFDSKWITLKDNKLTYNTLNSFDINWEKVVAVKWIKENIDPVILNQFILDSESFNMIYISTNSSNSSNGLAYFKAKWSNCIKSANLSVINYGNWDCLLKSIPFSIN